MKIEIRKNLITAAQLAEAKRIAKEYSSQGAELNDVAIIVTKHYFPSPMWRVLELKAGIERNQYCCEQYSTKSEDLDIRVEALLVNDDGGFINNFAQVDFSLSTAYQIAGDETPVDVDLQIYRRLFIRE